MASPEQLPEEVIIEIGQQDRIILANSALEVIQQFSRTAEVLIGLKRLINDSGIEDLPAMDDENIYDVPYATFKNIGQLLQRRMIDEKDMRSVKCRSDYTYRIVFDPDRDVKKGNDRSARNLGYLGASLGMLQGRR
jgi:hypothetical protein